MSMKAFQKGFADGFLSPFSFFLPPVRKPPSRQLSVPCHVPKLSDVSAAGAWEKVNEQISQAIQKSLSAFPEHLAHYQEHYSDRTRRLAALNEELSKLLEAIEVMECRNAGAEENEEREELCRK